MRHKRGISIVCLLCLLMVCVAGCWDSVEIEDRAFVLGVALDKGSKPGELKMTYQIAVPRAMGGQGGASGGGSRTGLF